MVDRQDRHCRQPVKVTKHSCLTKPYPSICIPIPYEGVIQAGQCCLFFLIETANIREYAPDKLKRKPPKIPIVFRLTNLTKLVCNTVNLPA